MNHRTNVALVIIAMLSAGICLVELGFVRRISEQSWREEAKQLHAQIESMRADRIQSDKTVDLIKQLVQNQQAFDEQMLQQPVQDSIGMPETVSAGAGAKEAPVAAQAPALPHPMMLSAAVTPPKPAAETVTDNPYGDGPSDAHGYLNLNSIPQTQVFVDGRLIGATPREHLPVSPGVHTVAFFNGRQGVSKTLSLSIVRGETKLAAVKFPQTNDGF